MIPTHVSNSSWLWFFDFSKTVAKRAFRVIQVFLSSYHIQSWFLTLTMECMIHPYYILSTNFVFNDSGYSQCAVCIFSSFWGFSFGR
ncbi:hypothetical protein CK203_031687 [Vitis vinifera]|uniref:Uncharacterized protein n=1 Tax=Vitis vinifera TaxID=29760 RepID=A0A438I3H5_VITVI|nr:hypothetical protein CK203_031687 [Vitis vinifera]